MKKLKVYIETSVISYLDQQERGEKYIDSHNLWIKIKAGKFEAVISDITRTEIDDCDELKRNVLNKYLNEIGYTQIEIDKRTIEVASRFIDLSILKEKNLDDCRHIAAAITSGCDIIASWNFKHIVNIKTISGVKAVTALEGYNDLLIYTPSTLIGGDEDD